MFVKTFIRAKANLDLELLEEEQVLHVISRHPLFFVLNILPAVISFAGAIVLLAIFGLEPIVLGIDAILLSFSGVFFWKTWLDYHYDAIFVTTHRLIFQDRHLLGRNINQVRYRSITNVRPRHTGIVSYVLGFGAIIIETAADSADIEHRFVRQHEKAATMIMQRCFEKANPSTPPTASGQAGSQAPAPIAPPVHELNTEREEVKVTQ